MAETLDGIWEQKQRIAVLLLKLKPASTELGQYFPLLTTWRDIPPGELNSVENQLKKELAALEHLGKEKYCASRSMAGKALLYVAAAERMAAMDDCACTWVQFKKKFAAELQMVELAALYPKGPAAKTSQSPQKATKVPKKPTKEELTAVAEAISQLNTCTKRAFKASSKATQACILARLREGFTPDDFALVIMDRARKWGKAPEYGQPDMREYLRPETLFSAKFEGYLNAVAGALPEKADILQEAAEYVPLRERKETT